MRTTTIEPTERRGAPRNRRSCPQLASEQALTRAEVLEARATRPPRRQIVIRHSEM